MDNDKWMDRLQLQVVTMSSSTTPNERLRPLLIECFHGESADRLRAGIFTDAAWLQKWPEFVPIISGGNVPDLEDVLTVITLYGEWRYARRVIRQAMRDHKRLVEPTHHKLRRALARRFFASLLLRWMSSDGTEDVDCNSPIREAWPVITGAETGLRRVGRDDAAASLESILDYSGRRTSDFGREMIGTYLDHLFPAT